MAILENLSNRTKTILERRYIDQVLDEEGENIVSEQNRLDKKYNFTTTVGRGRSHRVNDGRLVLEHNIVQRFVDMRKIKGVRKKRKTPIHNKVIFTHFNSILGKLRFGFTKALQEQLRGNYKIEING